MLQCSIGLAHDFHSWIPRRKWIDNLIQNTSNPRMKPMHLPDVESVQGKTGSYADLIRMVQPSGNPYPQIWHLFAFKPDATRHLEQFTQAIMRGPSPLSPGFRELIAAYTSKLNDCEF